MAASQLQVHLRERELDYGVVRGVDAGSAVRLIGVSRGTALLTDLTLGAIAVAALGAVDVGALVVVL